MMTRGALQMKAPVFIFAHGAGVLSASVHAALDGGSRRIGGVGLRMVPHVEVGSVHPAS